MAFRLLCLAARFGFEMFGGYFVSGIVWRRVVQKRLSGVASVDFFLFAMT